LPSVLRSDVDKTTVAGQLQPIKITPAMLVAIVFASCIALAAIAVYLLRGGPSELESCVKRFAAGGQSGRLVHVIPPSRTQGMRGEGPKKCECY
jgi:hypothetical protein